MRKMDKWTPAEASNIYWLVLWGYHNKDIIELTKDILKDRSMDAINGYTSEIRRYLSKLKGLPITHPITKIVSTTTKAASKIPPIKYIEDMRPTDTDKVEFIPTLNRNKPKSVGGNKPSPNFEQRPEDYVPPVKLPIPSEEEMKVKTLEQRGVENKPSGVSIDRIFSKVSKEDKQPSLEEVLTVAKKLGASKVQWRDYIIKFK